MEKNQFTNIHEKNIKNNFKIQNKNFILKERKSIKGQSPYRMTKLEGMEQNTEDGTKYGEFVSSYFNWMTLDEQKKRSKELNNMTKSNDDFNKF